MYPASPAFRIFQGLEPDIVCVQEFSVQSTFSGAREWVDIAFGTGFYYYLENHGGANGIISRWNIMTAGIWEDVGHDTLRRDFPWAVIDIPGDKDLQIVSVHLKAGPGTDNKLIREDQARQLKEYMEANFDLRSHYAVLAGDLNAYSRQSASEPMFAIFETFLDYDDHVPVDRTGNSNTNSTAPRKYPYDWIMPNHLMDENHITCPVGQAYTSFQVFPEGHVFDTHLYLPLSAVPPIEYNDLYFNGITHRPVLKAFHVKYHDIVADEGFDGFDAGTRPSGWTFTDCDSNSDTYTNSGYYGRTSPAIKLSADGARITTDTLHNATSLQFWMKGSANDGTTALLVEDHYHGEWYPLARFRDIPSTGTTVGPLNLYNPTDRIRFTFIKNSGNIALDNVIIRGLPADTTPPPTPSVTPRFITPTPTPATTRTPRLITPAPTAAPTATPSITPTPTLIPKKTPVPTPSPSSPPTATPTPRPITPTPSVTSTPGTTPTPMATMSPASTPSATPTAATPTATPSVTPSMTTTPVPTPRITPSIAFTPTPSITTTPTLTMTPTPVYCHDALEIADLESLRLARTRATLSGGWSYRVTRAESPADDIYGYIEDNANTFVDQSAYSSQPVALRITWSGEAANIQEGDYLLVTFGGGTEVYVYPPALTGNIDTCYYVGSDGSTYVDRWLYDLAKGVPTVTPTPTTTPTPGAIPSPEPTATPTPRTRPTPGATPIPSITSIPAARPTAQPTVQPTAKPTTQPTQPPNPATPAPTVVVPTPMPAAHRLIIASGDYNGDGAVEIAVFRGSSGLWAIREVTRVYFGSSSDTPVSGDYNGDGTSDIAIFRAISGLWAVRSVTRAYFGSTADLPVPGDYDGDGCCDTGIFRPDAGLWAIRGVTRAYFGGGGDTVVPGDYDGNGTKDIGLFRGSSGLWALRGVTRFYFGGSTDQTVPGDYDDSGVWAAGIFRSSTGLWAIRGVTRAYFGSGSDQPVPADYAGNWMDDITIFRGSSGLWAVQGVTRVYFGSGSDIPVTR